MIAGLSASAQFTNFNPYGVQKANSGDSLRLVGSASGQYLNVPTTKMLRSAITSSAYTAGYGMSLVDQQFRVDTSQIVTKFFSSKYSEKSRFINAKDLGAIGLGAFDNSTIINNALLNNKEVYFPEGEYYTTSFNNLYGSKITGPGIIYDVLSNGQRQFNLTADENQNIFGLEYLSAFQIALNEGQPVKAIWSGDSTTEGTDVAFEFTIPEIMKSLNIKNGISGVTNLNRGHSGQSTVQWQSTHLNNDLNELITNHGNLYIIRWGINDPASGRSAKQVIKTVDSCIASIRSNGNFAPDRLSIILSNCSATTGTNYGLKGEIYYEELSKGFRIIARKYKCAYIDLYKIFPDARQAANYMDTPIPSDTTMHVHPKAIQNQKIASVFFDAIYPQYFRQYTNNNNDTKLSSDQPNSYPDGVSLNFVLSSNGFPINGQLSTFQQKTNNLSYQTLSSFQTDNQVWMRGGFDGGWMPWKRVAYSSDLTGSGDRPVFAGSDGTLKIGDLSGFQTVSNLSSDLTSSSIKYPSVNAVNTGLASKLNTNNPTATGTLTTTGELRIGGDIIATNSGSIFRYQHRPDTLIIGCFLGGENFDALRITGGTGGKHFKSLIAPTQSNDIVRLGDISGKANTNGGNTFSGVQILINGSVQPLSGFTDSGFTNTLQAGQLTTNVNTYLPQDGGQLVNSSYVGKKQVLTASGNGSATTISIAHNMTGITSSSWVSAIANNAASAGIQYVTVDAANVNIFYTVAPVSGTNNLLYSIEVKQ